MAEKDFSNHPLLQERANAELSELHKKLQKQLKHDVNRQIYSHNVVKHKEDIIVSQIKKLAKSRKSDPGSPESDVFITPKDSPSEVPNTYKGGKCNFPKPDVSYSQEHKKNSHYYNLVHLEEEFNSLSSEGSINNLLERELAEQDQLFKSFHSIIIKEAQDQKKKPAPTAIKGKKSVIVKPVKKLPKKFLVRPLKNEFIDCGFDSEYLNLEGNYKRKDGVGMSHGKVEEIRDEVVSSGETTGCQESSGYVTGGSPLGFSEDLARDERSGASSPSVTWDSVLQDPTGPLEEPPGLSAPPDVSSPKSNGVQSTNSPSYCSLPMEKGLNSRDDVLVVTSHSISKGISPFCISPVGWANSTSPPASPLRLEQSRSLERRLPDTKDLIQFDQISQDECLHLPGQHSDPQPSFSCPPFDQLTHSKPPPGPTNVSSQPSDNQILNQEIKNETLCTIKTNYFIDASNLHDEDSVVPNLSIDYITQSSIDFVEPKEVTKDFKSALEEKVYSLSESFLETFKDNGISELNPSIVSPKSSSDHNGQLDSPPKPALIRHNTFEMEPKQDKFISSVNDLGADSHNFYNESKVKSDSSKHFNINNLIPHEDSNSETKLFIPLSESKPFQNEEELHSPDSLNNENLENDSLQAKASETEDNHLLIEDVDFEFSTHTPNIKLINKVVVQNDSLTSTVQLLCNNAVTSDLEMRQVNGIEHGVGSKTSNAGSDVDENERSLINNEMFVVKTKYSNDFESVPIVSGRAVVDLSQVEPPPISPKIRRKTENTPILSGAAQFSPEKEEVKLVKPKVSQCMTTSWTIDMSDSRQVPQSEPVKTEKPKPSNPSFGFFVPLNDSATIKECEESVPLKKTVDKKIDDEPQTQSNQGSSCGFYIDLKNDFESLDSQISVQSEEQEVAKPEKKLFSMFIDISDSCSKSSDSTSPKSKTSSPFLPPRKAKGRNNVARCDDPSTSLSSDSGLDMGEHPEVSRGKALFGSPAPANNTSSSSESSKKQSFFMFIEANDVKVSRRKTLPHGLTQSLNRHSWNSDTAANFTEASMQPSQDHKRANSISVDKTNFNGVCTDPLSGPASIDNAQINKLISKAPNRMMASWHGPVKPSSELSKIIKNSKKRESLSGRENISSRSISEKGDKEDISLSVKSDEVFDSNASISSRDDNRTFVIDDLSKVAHANTSELEMSTSSHDVISDLSKDDTETDKVQEESVCSNKTQKSEEQSTDILEEATPVTGARTESRMEVSDSFVKLSDMDKKVPTSLKENRKSCRMTRSIPDGSTIVENKILTKSSTSRSLSRLFPHLSSQFQPEPDDVPSNITTSMHSSLNPSLEVSEEAWSGEYSRLGEDLLRMFLEEISPDVVVEVGGRRIKAHKCILSSRCQYFAGMLSGGWVESAGNVISLQGFSYNTVHFALCHIYSGSSNVPDSINIVELATLADMLCLEGLKEVITYTLKVKYCHFFHKPCSECVVGVVECLPVAAAYGLDEIYRRSLRWITRHYVRVWPTKAFSALPKELQDKCYKQHIIHMNAENILDTIMGCEKLEATIPNVRWAQTIVNLNTKLQETCHKYLTNHFNEVLSSNTFLSLSREDSWTVSRLEEVLVTMSESLQADQACLSYSKLHAMAAAITPQTDFKMEFVSLLNRLESKVEECIVKQAGRAARTPAWTKLDPAFRRKIQEAACLVFSPGDSKRSTVLNLQQRSLSKSDPLRSAVSSLERRSKQPSKSVTTSQTLPKTTNAKVNTVDKGSKDKVGSQSVKMNGTVTGSLKGRGSVAQVKQTKQPPVKQQPQSNSPSPLMRPKNNKYSQVKSRYMEPKPIHKENSEDKLIKSRGGSRPGSTGRAAGSSSESSRTASPAFRHATMSTDSLEAVAGPSRRSLGPQPRIAKTLTTRRPAGKPTSATVRSSTFTKSTEK